MGQPARNSPRFTDDAFGLPTPSYALAFRTDATGMLKGINVFVL